MYANYLLYSGIQRKECDGMKQCAAGRYLFEFLLLHVRVRGVVGERGGGAKG